MKVTLIYKYPIAAIVVLLLYGIFNFSFTYAQANVANPVFTTDYNLTNYTKSAKSDARDVKYVSDGILFSGFASYKNSPIGYVATVGKLSFSGDTLWVKKIPLTKYTLTNLNNFIVQFSDNRFALIYTLLDSNYFTGEFVNYTYLYFFNSQGDSLGTKKLNTTYQELFNIVKTFTVTQDKGILMSGIKLSRTLGTYTYPNDGPTRIIADTQGFYIAKYDSLGNLLWHKSQMKKHNPQQQVFRIMDILQKKDGNILLAKLQNYDMTFSRNAHVIELDSVGEFIQEKMYSVNQYGTGSTLRSKILQGETDSIFYLFFDIESLLTLSYNPSIFIYGTGYCVKLNNSLQTLWAKPVAETRVVLPTDSVKYSYTGDKILTAKFKNNKLYVLESNEFKEPGFLFIMDTTGKINAMRNVWAEYKAPDSTYVRSINNFDVADSNLIFCGGNIKRIWYPPKLPGLPPIDSSIMYTLFIQSNIKACVNPGCDSVDIRWQVNDIPTIANKQIITIQVFPNPTLGNINIKTSIAPPFIINVYNMQGHGIITKSIDTANTQVDLSSYSAGIYYVRVSASDGSSQVLKVVRE